METVEQIIIFILSFKWSPSVSLSIPYYFTLLDIRIYVRI